MQGLAFVRTENVLGPNIEAKWKVLNCQKREKKNVNGELVKDAVEGASKSNKVRTFDK